MWLSRPPPSPRPVPVTGRFFMPTMNAASILDELRPLGRESYRKVLRNHGVPEPLFGVRISELQVIRKRIKKDYPLALDLYETGNYDAMYLAGLIADDARMTREDLRRWLDLACAPLAGCVVPWVAAGSPHGWEVGLEWIDAREERAAVAGWATLSCLASVRPDAELDLAAYARLLRRVEASIHAAPDRVRYQMNGFVIAVGCYLKTLTQLALEIAARIGPVAVDMGETDCQVPEAVAYIRKVEARGAIGKKRRSAKC